MNTLYIDVYFLINFTVDTLAIYFSVLLSKVNVSRIRLIICGIIGAVAACITVLFELDFLFYFLTVLITFYLISVIASGKNTVLKRFKVFLSFLIFETLLGGLVSYFYNFLDDNFVPLFNEESFGVENKQLLILSMMILLSIGILKLIFFVFSGNIAEKTAEISFTLLDESFNVTGLVDSGNILKDPLTLKPVMIVKYDVIKNKIKDFSSDVIYTSDSKLKGILRMIPVKSLGGEKILIGFKCFITIKGKKHAYGSDIIIAIDEEEGSFGGYKALIPSELLLY